MPDNTEHRLDKIYTRGGDKGKTSLALGQRLYKSDDHIQSLGDIDELNCQIGVVIALLPASCGTQLIGKDLLKIQNILFDIGAELAMHGSDYPTLQQSFIDNLESRLDALNEQTPSLKEFILPGGHPSAAQCHLARSVCRRAERQLVKLDPHQKSFSQPLKYLNRLSDYLFVAARYLNLINQHPETLWQPNTKR